MTVLVLDRDRREARRIHELLEERGHSCLVAQDIPDAEWLLGIARVDAIAIGSEVPESDGLAWLEELCLRRPKLAARTVMIASRLLDPDEVRRVQACGAGFLQRPVEIEDLERVIEARLERERAASRRDDAAPRTRRKPAVPGDEQP